MGKISWRSALKLTPAPTTRIVPNAPQRAPLRNSAWHRLIRLAIHPPGCYRSPPRWPALNDGAGFSLFRQPILLHNATVSPPFEQNYGWQVSPATAFAAAWLLAGIVGSAGCSNLASQAANVEGVRLYQQGNYQQASDRFQQAIAQDPKSPDGYYNLAASLHKTGTLYNRPNDLQQAENLYNQCLERDPSHTEAYRGLAVLLTETNRQREAFNLLNHWASANPKSADPKIELARLLEESGQIEQAKSQLVDALTSDPNNARALTALGRLRDQAGDHQQALTNYQRSLALNRFQPEVAARIAQLQGAAGAPATAVPSAATRSASGWQPTQRY